LAHQRQSLAHYSLAGGSHGTHDGYKSTTGRS
jgi:hypothetical protein